jgi:hypothetical protein
MRLPKSRHLPRSSQGLLDRKIPRPWLTRPPIMGREKRSRRTIAARCREHGALRVPHRSPGYSDWVTSDDYQKLFDAMVQQRRYPRVVEARAFNGILLYHAAFAPYPAAMFSFWSHHGLTPDDFAQKNRLHRRDGFRLAHKQSVHLDGREFIQATWVRP